MKKFSLLKLFPTGNFASGNLVMNEVSWETKKKAIEFLQRLYPELNLDDNGYAKHGEITYCVAEHYSC